MRDLCHVEASTCTEDDFTKQKTCSSFCHLMRWQKDDNKGWFGQQAREPGCQGRDRPTPDGYLDRGQNYKAVNQSCRYGGTA